MRMVCATLTIIPATGFNGTKAQCPHTECKWRWNRDYDTLIRETRTILLPEPFKREYKRECNAETSNDSRWPCHP